MVKFENNEEKLKHIGLMCSINLHDAFANLSSIISLCGKQDLTEKECIELIKEKANQTYDLFRVIENYRHQQDNSKTETFLVSDLGKKVEKYYRFEKLELNIVNDFQLTCKKTLLVQSLINLIDNAYKHNNNDYDNKKVLVTIDKGTITVSDNGIGVPDEIKNKIFELFFTTKDLDKLYGEHNGIGLYGVKQHIDNLGYKINIDNDTIMKGANFTIQTT